MFDSRYWIEFFKLEFSVLSVEICDSFESSSFSREFIVLLKAVISFPNAVTLSSKISCSALLTTSKTKIDASFDSESDSILKI